MNNNQTLTISEMNERVCNNYYRCNTPVRVYPCNNPDKSSRWKNVTMSQLSFADFQVYQVEKEKFTKALAEYEADLKEYQRENNRLEQEFWHDAAVACGVADHPKLGKLRCLAYEFGHSYGYGEMWRYFNEMAELLTD
jgi:hypothetical protein